MPQLIQWALDQGWSIRRKMDPQTMPPFYIVTAGQAQFMHDSLDVAIEMAADAFGTRPAAQPAPWQPIEKAPKDKFLLLACPSGYTTTPWVFTTGIMHSDYKAGRWVDHANDDLTDWGMVPAFWTDEFTEPNQVRQR